MGLVTGCSEEQKALHSVSLPQSKVVDFQNLLQNLLLSERNEKKKKREEMCFELNLANRVLYILYQTWFLLSFQVITAKMLRQHLISLPCTIVLWRVHLLMHLFQFQALPMFINSKEWLDTYQSNKRKYDYMHQANAGTFYFSLLAFVDICCMQYTFLQ